MTIDHLGLAEELRDAEARCVGAPFIVERYPTFGWEDARAVARARDDLRRADGDELIGYKLGWTSSAMRDALGIDQPNWGTLWRSQVLDGPLERRRLIHPKIEPELVYRVDEPGTPGQWALGLEVVDPRFPSFAFDWLDNTADNSSCARIVIGPFGPLTGEPDAVQIQFTDMTTTRQGVGADAMGSPATAVDWLKAQLHGEGANLEAGHIVFSGGLAAPFDIAVGSYRCRSTDLPEVEITVR